MSDSHVHVDGETPQQKATRLAGREPTNAEKLLKVLNQSSNTWEAERVRIARDKREAAEREATHAADAEAAERERLERITAQGQLPSGAAAAVPELPVITYDPVHGTLVKLSGDKLPAERLLGVPIQE